MGVLRGDVIEFDRRHNRGLVSGHDGQEYVFVTESWNGPSLPRRGTVVEFLPSGDDATEIYAVAGGSSHHRLLLLVIACGFLGFLGLHRFIVGRPVSAILMLLTGGGFGLWMLLDLVLLAKGSFIDGQGRRITEWT